MPEKNTSKPTNSSNDNLSFAALAIVLITTLGWFFSVALTYWS